MFIFVFKQKTAYEMRIRDWSSDVCSSDLTHILMLDDRSITDATIGYIRSQHINAEAALRKTRDALIAVFEQMDDAYLRTRRDDVAHVCARIQRVLMRSERQLQIGRAHV